MTHPVPDLTPTVIDSETGDVLHQGLEGAERDEWDRRRAPEWAEFYRTRDERLHQKLCITPEMLGISSQ